MREKKNPIVEETGENRVVWDRVCKLDGGGMEKSECVCFQKNMLSYVDNKVGLRNHNSLLR